MGVGRDRGRSLPSYLYLHSLALASPVPSGRHCWRWVCDNHYSPPATVCSQDASPLPCVRRRALGDRGHSVPGSSSPSPSEAYITWEWMRRYLPQLRLWSKGECHRNTLSLIFASDLTSAHYGFSLNNTLSMKERSTCNFSPSSQSWLWRKDSGNCALWITLCAAEH